MHASYSFDGCFYYCLPQLFLLLSQVQQLYASFYLSLPHIVLLLHILLPLCLWSLCDLVPSFFLFLLFPPIISVICLSLFCCFCSLSSAISSTLSFPLFICLACLFRSFLLPLSHSLLSSLHFHPLLRCLCDIVCLRAHDGVRRAPSCLTQCSLLPTSICWSSQPHRPAQRAGWGA